MASVHSGEKNIAERFNPLSIGCTSVTDNRRNCDSKDRNLT